MVRITGATTYIVGNPWKNWVFVRLDTDQPGLYGIGEGTLNGFAKTVEAAIHELAPRYQGMDPFQVETIFQRMARDLYSDGGQIHMNAAAAIEIAQRWVADGRAEERLRHLAELALQQAAGLTDPAATRTLAKRFDAANRARNLLHSTVRADLAVAESLLPWS